MDVLGEQSWVDQLNAVFRDRDTDRLADLFEEGCTWRDLMVFGWAFQTYAGRDAILPALERAFDERAPCDACLVRPDVTTQGSEDARDAFFRFRTSLGTARGYVSLRYHAGDKPGWRAVALVTELLELAGFEPRIGTRRDEGRKMGPVPGRIGWQEQRSKEAGFQDADPAVLIVGGGHAGLMMAAYLETLGVSTLIVERNARVGDNWRKRYPSLALHDPQSVGHFPYMPFPETWTQYTPKDKFADFLEAYATLLDLNIWTGSSIGKVQYDESAGHWCVAVERGGHDAGERLLYPRHLIIATGANAEVNFPELPGSGQFGGTVVHSGDFRGAQDWIGRKAVVIGSGVSAHDVAQNLAEAGVGVTMVQKSSTYVVDAPKFHRAAYAHYEDESITTAEADLMGALFPFGLLPEIAGAALTAALREQDVELLDGLQKRGFRLNFGPDDQGVLGIVMRTGKHGYYYNVGASELIVDGHIGVRSGVTVDHYTADGVALTNGERLDADLVVWATGYATAMTGLRNLLGAEIADRVQPILKVDNTLEMGAVWQKSPVKGLWLIHSLGIAMSRFYSRLTALHIRAIEAQLTDL